MNNNFIYKKKKTEMQFFNLVRSNLNCAAVH